MYSCVAALYHPDDIRRVRENDWFIVRYLLHQDRDVDLALKFLRESLKFRKDMEINTVKKEDLPENYFDVRAVQLYNRDHKGCPVLVIRTKVHIKNTKTRRLQQQYMLYWVEQGMRVSDWGAVSILFDCTGASYSNWDMDMTRFILNVFKQYYPWGLCYFMVYNMPWYLSALWKVIKKWIPEKHVSRVVFVDSASIQEYIEKDQLPVCMGGTCTDIYEAKDAAEESSSQGWF